MARQNEIVQNYGLKEELFQAAVAARASDIHVDPTANALVIRFRIDGILKTWLEADISEHESLVSQFKAIAELDLARHSKPQGGHFVWLPADASNTIQKSGGRQRVLDVRISIFPTVFGEAAVMRIFNRPDILMDMKDLGMAQPDFDLLWRLVTLSHGMVLVTGPTSAGKTTTIYSILQTLAGTNQNIITLEDPVEYYLDKVRQSQISPEHGYTYAEGIKSILRQDPDTIMVGEIRDFETAENAFRTSLTGRLVLSTLHVNDSIGTISRLLDMQVERSMLAYALKGVVNQRLVGRICEHCKGTYTPPAEVLSALGIATGEQFFRGKGCAQCGDTGFFQRVALFEVLPIDEVIQRMVISNVPISEIRALLVERKFKTLHDDGIEKIRQGLTTPEEVLKQTSALVVQTGPVRGPRDI